MPHGIEYQFDRVTIEKDTGNRLRVSSSGDELIGGVNTASGAIDAFARQRISFPETLFDSKQIFDNLPLFWDDQETSGGGTTSTHSTATASTTMGVALNTAGTRVRQTFRRFNYQPGKSQLVVLTGVLGSAEDGITRRIGYFDENNGLFFELKDSVLSVVVRSFASGSPVDTVISRANWNIDTMDGNGPSGLTLDTSKSAIFFMDFEWLGVGPVRYGLFVNNAPIYVHATKPFNELDTVYMSTPNLPVRYEISNDGTGAAATLLHICSSVISEGGQEETGVTRSVSRDASSLTTGNDALIYPLLSIRLKSTHLGATVKPIKLGVICTSNADYEVMLILNPTVAGVDAVSWVAVPNSAVEYDISRDNTNTLTGGTRTDATLQQDTNQSSSVPIPVDNVLALGSAIDGTPDELVLGVRRLTGTTETFLANLSYRELL